MQNKEKEPAHTNPDKKEKEKKKKPSVFHEDAKFAPGYQNLLGVAPEISDPPVPNRAWTEMRVGRDIDELSEEEKADLYLGRDNLF